MALPFLHFKDNFFETSFLAEGELLYFSFDLIDFVDSFHIRGI